MFNCKILFKSDSFSDQCYSSHDVYCLYFAHKEENAYAAKQSKF